MKSKKYIYDEQCRDASQRLFILLLFFTITNSAVLSQNPTDTSRILQRVTITAEKKQSPYTSIVPVQILNHEALRQINAENIAEAAKYFSGVLIKDYGGIGGLKTIS